MNELFNEVNIDFLFLDLKSCNRCIGTETSLKNAVNKVTNLLGTNNIKININKLHIDDESKAKEYGLEVSPTIRINGLDIQSDWIENKCSDCGELCNCAEDISCRLWKWEYNEYTSPPESLIIDAILRSLYSNNVIDSKSQFVEKELNSNLKTFFSEKENSSKNCNCSCC